MFKQILVPLDGSRRAERAIPIAVQIAASSGGTVHFFRVIDLAQEYSASFASVVPSLREQEQEHAHAYLARLAETSRWQGIEIHTESAHGMAASAILSRAQGMDLVVLTSHGYTGLKRWALGSVAQHVARSSPVPVLVLREDSPRRLDERTTASVRALVALDGSPFAAAALLPAAQVVTALAVPGAGALHLMRVVELPPLSEERHPALRSLEVREQAMQEATRALCAQVDEARRTWPGMQITWSVVSDGEREDVAETLVRAAELGDQMGVADMQGCDLIVMSTHGRSGWHRWMLGSITERVLSSTSLPLLVVRPHSTRADSHEARRTALPL